MSWTWSTMRSGAVSAVIAIVAAISAGCTSSSETAEPDAAPAAPTSTATEDPALRGAPEVGSCWNVPPEGFTPGHHFNDSPIVACTEPHTTETVFVTGIAAPTVQAGNEWQDQCRVEANDYVGVAQDHWVPVSALLYLPSKKQVAAGASWVRCDVAFPRDWNDVFAVEFDGNWEQSVRTFSAKDAATEHTDAVRPCLQRDPAIRNQWLVSCGKPHRYEATGQVAQLGPLDHYPSPNQLQRGSIQCRDGLPAEQRTDAFGVTAVWQPPEAFPSDYIGGLLGGACFVYRQDGTRLPPRT